ncbi:NAD(P)/FAD-dependent oxidoreductase [Saccharopolyspora spinosa]|uniref:3-phenylpropionate/trans-cinnamate dioxygenase ferredoxin reductase subunit n=1 Tax=Saccharopolyspora spinosa TaxID=60894 RepID=A0A2N3XPV5_SACSN|nr:FAD-dependent oxidoreductase [Saccharopolyspora spinosa]PKW12714.1 3-phenylpropionate/trans-cinnamate dioxygenase ferredoxin reductase subunit [Saccharopolyspora spinosa]
MADSETFVIVGAGMAGAKGAQALRDLGFDGRIALLGDEPHRPYERPPLSKAYLMGNADFASAYVHDESWYADNRVDLQLEVSVRRIDRALRQVELSDNSRIDFDKLLIATGAHPRSLPVPGIDADGVLYLRRVEDSDLIKQTLNDIEQLVVVGAGWIGLEVTAAAREAGVAVTVVETTELPLLRVLGPEVAEVFAALHRDHGVDFRFGTAVSEILVESGRATGVRLNDGTEVPAQAVLVAVGVEPDVALARDAGLRVENGILVDASLRTGDPNIVAAGDVANAFNPLLGKQIRVEHWANALNQPATAAASMLGRDGKYSELPYFFTDQYDLGMEYLGYVDPDGYDQVVFRGDVQAREFIAFWLAEGRVLAGMNVNIWDVQDQIKTLITSATTVDTSLLADPETPLNELIAR